MEGIVFEAGLLDGTLAAVGLFVMLAVALGAILFGYIADEEARGRRLEWLEEPLAMAGQPGQAEEMKVRKAA